jgi:ABC-type antimicrobial peptide transport system permease subunit
VLLLSAAGIHALMSLTVTRRRREIGIRTALGADSSRLLANIFARAAWQLGLGGLVGSLLGAGLLLGSGAAWREASISLGGVVMLLLTAGLAAAVGPARRGLRIRPMEALKEE